MEGPVARIQGLVKRRENHYEESRKAGNGYT
jgi:hypothetical protein